MAKRAKEREICTILTLTTAIVVCSWGTVTASVDFLMSLSCRNLKTGLQLEVTMYTFSEHEGSLATKGRSITLQRNKPSRRPAATPYYVSWSRYKDIRLCDAYHQTVCDQFPGLKTKKATTVIAVLAPLFRREPPVLGQKGLPLGLNPHQTSLKTLISGLFHTYTQKITGHSCFTPCRPEQLLTTPSSLVQ